MNVKMIFNLVRSEKVLHRVLSTLPCPPPPSISESPMPRREIGGGNNKGADKYLFEGGVLHTNKQCRLLDFFKI